MKCPKCGKTIGIEVLKCPACGNTNPLAKKHKENIQKYDRRFRETQESVLKSAQKTEGVGIRGGIFAILVAVIVILALVCGVISAAGEGETSDDRKRDSLKHKTEYYAQMREYLEEGDYITFVSFAKYHRIPFNYEPYKDYNNIQYVAEKYFNCVKYWEKILLRSDDPDYWDSSELDISILCTNLESFVKSYAYNAEKEKNRDFAAYLEDMNADIRAMVKRYLKMTDDEADTFLGYSEARMAVTVEEIILGEASEDE